MLDSLIIENFTAFRKVKLNFVAGINVLVGANASGKTHAMKLMYAMQKMQKMHTESSRGDVKAPDILDDVFRPERPGDLIRYGSQSDGASVTTNWKGSSYQLSVRTDAIRLLHMPGPNQEEIATPVLIPVKDMLAHSVGFLSLYDQRFVDFDGTHRDILLLAFLPTLRENGRKEINPLLDKLAEKMEGRVEVRGERFYIVGEKGRFEMHLVAEGWRKLALLYQLLANGSVARGTVLYWDEPEANLNPSLMDEVVAVLLELSRLGVQIFLATHSYIILKELELQKQHEDSVQLFAMARDLKDGSVSINPAASYDELKPNLIEEQYERIYELEIDRALGG